MSETTLERLARAYMRGFYGARNEQIDTAPPTEAELEGVATLLRELREPTEKMLLAGQECDPWYHHEGQETVAGEIWQAMLDHILSEGNT